MLCYSSPPAGDVDYYSDGRFSSHSRGSALYSSARTSSDGGRVILSQPDGRALHQPVPPKLTNYIGLAVVVLICFNLPFGILAVILSVKSNKDFVAGNFEGGRSKGKLSMVISVTGILITITTILLVIFWPIIIKRPRDIP